MTHPLPDPQRVEWGYSAEQVQGLIADAIKGLADEYVVPEPLGDGYTQMITIGDTPSTLEYRRVTIAGFDVFSLAQNQEAYAAGYASALSAEPVGAIMTGLLTPIPGPWCRSILLYSSDNSGDSPERRTRLYTMKGKP